MEVVGKMPGVVIPGDFDFDGIISPFKRELSTCCWWIDDQSGPFDSLWLYSDINEELADRTWIEVPEFHDTSVTAWGQGFVPRLHEHVIIDEWTYFYASNCDPQYFPERAVQSQKLLSCGAGFNPEFFRMLVATGDFFIMHVDGWWEAYTKNDEWRRQLLDHFPNSFERTWRKAGEPPDV